MNRRLACWSLSTPLLACLSTQALGASRVRNSRPPRQPIDRGPSETRAERDRRLQRECKGKPNAGACEGYAS